MSELIDSERCVADAAILIDLDHTNLLPALLDSDVSLITTPDILQSLNFNCRQELETCQRKGQVVIEAATVDDMNSLINEVGLTSHMSVSDGLLCRIARRLNVSLLSDCNYLSHDAEKRGIRARSFIWVLDRLVKTRVLRPISAATLLDDMQRRNPWINKRMAQKHADIWRTLGNSDQWDATALSA